MNINQSFHEVRFPTNLALGASGGPTRRTEIVTMGSGREQRNARWAHSRRQFNAGYGVKTVSDLQFVIEFFEERRGRLFGFRFRDPLDWKSGYAHVDITQNDQLLGYGDGSTTEFQLTKQYGSSGTGYIRKITKPVAGSLIVSVDGNSVSASGYDLDATTGVVTFQSSHVPQSGKAVRAGFEFDIPVRFDTDEISINLSHFEAGDIPSIPLVELLP